MKNYSDAVKYLGSKTERPIGTGRATRIHRLANGDIAIRYQVTDVVVYHADGTTSLFTGGWQTHTTKERIKEYSSAHIFQEKGLWYFAPKNFNWADRKNCSLFYDGVTVGPDGQPLEPRSPETTTTLKTKLDRLVSKYIKGYVEYLKENGITEPSGGDCWGCYFNVCALYGHATGTQTGKGRLEGGKLVVDNTTGKPEPLGVDHYFSHFEEKYYVPSILFSALKVSGYRDPGFILALIKSDLEKGRESYHLAKVLRDYFRKLKPALLKELEGRQERAQEEAA